MISFLYRSKNLSMYVFGYNYGFKSRSFLQKIAFLVQTNLEQNMFFARNMPFSEGNEVTDGSWNYLDFNTCKFKTQQT